MLNNKNLINQNIALNNNRISEEMETPYTYSFANKGCTKGNRDFMKS
ncbi:MULTISPECIES: hypothetical protein [Myroides]|nr:hypothetical protein [Myroides phaeus]